MGAQAAAVASAAGTPIGQWIVAAVSEAEIEAELESTTNDVAFPEGDERRPDTESRPLDTGARAEIGHTFERLYELRAAVRIARVVDRVDADEDVHGTHDLRPSEREREKDRVPRRNIRGRDISSREIAIARDIGVRGQRGAADGP